MKGSDFKSRKEALHRGSGGIELLCSKLQPESMLVYLLVVELFSMDFRGVEAITVIALELGQSDIVDFVDAVFYEDMTGL